MYAGSYRRWANVGLTTAETVCIREQCNVRKGYKHGTLPTQDSWADGLNDTYHHRELEEVNEVKTETACEHPSLSVSFPLPIYNLDGDNADQVCGDGAML